jgi:hypothetical protein
MGRTCGVNILVYLLIMLVSSVSAANGEGNGTAEQAVVKQDSLAVYSKSAATGKVKRYLKKGDVVFIDAEVTDSSGTAWCGVREESEEWITGFVQCEGLDKKESAKSEKWRALPYIEEPAPEQRQLPQISPRPPKALPPPVESPKSPEPPAVAPPEIMVPRGY